MLTNGTPSAVVGVKRGVPLSASTTFPAESRKLTRPVCKSTSADALPVFRVTIPAASLTEKSVEGLDRKSTRLNSSHVSISYAVFCLKKKTWTRSPGHDSYWRFHRDSFFELLPEPGGLTLDVGCVEGRLDRDLVARGHQVVVIDGSPT